jgi:DUF1016 N-terminal domain
VKLLANRVRHRLRVALTTSPSPEFDDVLRLIDAAHGRAVAAVNKELIDLYWKIGERISRKIAAEGWASCNLMLSVSVSISVSAGAQNRLFRTLDEMSQFPARM